MPDRMGVVVIGTRGPAQRPYFDNSKTSAGQQEKKTSSALTHLSKGLMCGQTSNHVNIFRVVCLNYLLHLAYNLVNFSVAIGFCTKGATDHLVQVKTMV